MSPISGLDGAEISGDLCGRGFRGEVGTEVACSGLRGDWEVRKGKHMVKPTWPGKGGEL